MKFEGKSIINGLKDLVVHGAAHATLPVYLSSLHTNPAQTFTLKDEERPKQIALPTTPYVTLTHHDDILR